MNARQFLGDLAERNIVPREELANLRRALSPEQLSAAPDAVARDLVRRKKLTRYQAARVFQGHAAMLVFGDYLVLDKLGEGGMGQVFKAEHRRMKRIVALKILPPRATGSKMLVDRFYKEVELAARLSHPNIVTAYDAGEANGLHYMAMEYVDGCDLSTQVKTNGRLPVDQAMNCILQAARGLQYAHEQGIIHRDVKPSNLIVNPLGVVKILDMGLARIEHSFAEPVPAGKAELTDSGQLLGTVDYMAPEQSYDSRKADHRSDIYSLGCTLYRLLTDSPPYLGETMLQKLLAHREQPIPSLRDARNDVPRGLDALYQRMIAKSPDERPQSMREIVTSLESLLTGTAVESSTVMHLERPPTDDDGLDSFLQRLASGSSVGAAATGTLSASNADTPLPGSSATLRGEPKSNSSVVRWKNRPLTLATAGVAAVAVVALMIGLASMWFKRPVPDEKRVTQAPAVLAPAKSAPAVPIPAEPPPEPKKERTRQLVDEIPKTIVADGDASFGKPSKPATKPAATVATKSPEAPTKAAAPPSSKAVAAAPAQNPAVKPADQKTSSTAAVAVRRLDSLSEPMDLLKLIDSSPGASSGKFMVDSKGLSGDATLRFAVIPPDEYDLTALIDDFKLPGECGFGLPVQNRATTVLVSRASKPSWSLSVNQPNWPAQRALALPDGPLTIVCSVRKDRVHVTFDGKTALDWVERPGAPTLQSSLVGDRHQLCAQIKGKLHVGSLQIGPPSARLPAHGLVDLLAGPDANRATMGVVREEQSSMVLDTTTDKTGSCIGVSSERPSEYVLSAVVERLSGTSPFELALPIGEARLSSVIDRSDGTAEVVGLGPREPSSDRLLLTPWRPHLVVATVYGGNLAHIDLAVDGRDVIRREGPLDKLTVSPGVKDPGAFFVRGDSSFRLDRLETAPLGWQKLPQPGTDELAAAVKAVESMVASLRERQKADDKTAAIQTLWREATRSAGDPARRWALLDAAARLAAAEGDLALACRLAIDLTRVFDADLDEWYAKLFTPVFKGAKAPNARQALGEEVLHQLGIALALEEFGLAAALVSAANTVKSLPAELHAELKSRDVEIGFWRAQQSAGIKALAALANAADSRENQSAAGQYLAVVRSDWATAAAHLQAGGQTRWAELCLREAQPRDDRDAFAVAEQWWDLSTQETTPLKWWCAERAALWYRRAAPNVSGKSKAAVETKTKTLTRLRKSSANAFRLRHPLDALHIGNRWFKLYAAPMSWQRADLVCRSLGGSLPIVKTPQDNDAVVQVVRSATGGNERRTCWLGGTDEAKEGEFRWLDGTPLASGYVNWRRNEPDNSGGEQDHVAMLVLFEKGQLKSEWFDDRPSAGYFCVCVWDE